MLCSRDGMFSAVLTVTVHCQLGDGRMQGQAKHRYRKLLWSFHLTLTVVSVGERRPPLLVTSNRRMPVKNTLR
jgi:hypothetical protein